MIERWDIITIGNLSRNRYWGESDERAYRPAICTCTLISGREFRILVDPAFAEAERMMGELDRRSGLAPEAIDVVFITHDHGDHHAGLRHFPGALWLAAPEVAEQINATARYQKLVEGVTGRIFETVEVIDTPGHTAGHHSLRFDCDGLSVLVAGDAVMTRDFWRERRGYFNSADFTQAASTMDALAAIADIIVPGHDNYFLTQHTGGPR